jgi:hypothetical protein
MALTASFSALADNTNEERTYIWDSWLWRGAGAPIAMMKSGPTRSIAPVLTLNSGGSWRWDCYIEIPNVYMIHGSMWIKNQYFTLSAMPFHLQRQDHAHIGGGEADGRIRDYWDTDLAWTLNFNIDSIEN